MSERIFMESFAEKKQASFYMLNFFKSEFKKENYIERGLVVISGDVGDYKIEVAESWVFDGGIKEQMQVTSWLNQNNFVKISGAYYEKDSVKYWVW